MGEKGRKGKRGKNPKKIRHAASVFFCTPNQTGRKEGDNVSEDNREIDFKGEKTGIGVNGNLIPASMRSPEERAELARRGAKANRENRQREKNMQECMKAILSLTVSKKDARRGLEEYEGLISDNPTIMEVLNLVQVREAREGNTKAYEVVRDTAGFKPVERQEITADIMTDSDKALLEKVSRRVGVDPDKLTEK